MQENRSPKGGTNHTTDGLRSIARLPPIVNLRLLFFALVVGLGVLLVLWLQAGIGRQMRDLEQEFRAIHAQGYYVAVEMRVRFRKLNDTFLDLHLHPQSAEPTAFLAEANELKDWLGKMEAVLATDVERRLFKEMEEAYTAYCANARRLLHAQDGHTDRAAFADTFERVEVFSEPVLATLTHLVKAQETAFEQFMKSSRATLARLERLLNLSLVLLFLAGGALVVLLYRGTVTPLRRRLTESQAMIARQEKLASLGTLAAGVAHEIRNPLTAIKFRLFSFKKSLPPALAEQEDLPIINNEINRLDRIVKDFLQFARPADPELARVSAPRLLKEVAELLTPELEKNHIVLELEAAETIWVETDAQQIEQVLINLVQNAADSIGLHGKITLRAAPGTASLGGRSRPVVILAVADTGQGIPPEVEQRLFDPFFSTKEDGTGLGLAVAARIVEKHGGLLRYRTQLQRGTTFEIVLPQIDDHAS